MSDIEFQVWWIPQIPMTPFTYPVPDLDTGLLLLDVLAKYDLFQLENKVKPDYSNAGGLNYRGSATDGAWWSIDENDPDDIAEVRALVEDAS